MTTTQVNMTADDLRQLPEDHMRHELVRGQLTTMPLNTGDHGEVSLNVAVEIGNHVKSRKLGTVMVGGVGFVLSRNPDTVRTADVTFISKGRLGKDGLSDGFVPYAPDLAIEVVCQYDMCMDIQDKIEDFLQAGTAMVWILNPRNRTVTVRRSGRDPRILRENDALSGEEVCPEFSVRVAGLFR